MTNDGRIIVVHWIGFYRAVDLYYMAICVDLIKRQIRF